jgi:hypothetical protein
MIGVICEISDKLFDNSKLPLEKLAEALSDLIQTAEDVGIVITIERRPYSPLAMGNHYPAIVMSPKRIMSDFAHGWRHSTTGKIIK